MHEMALCQGIVEAIEDQARTHAVRVVKSVRLVIGALSHVEPDAIEFGFDVASRGTIAEGAELIIERPAGQAYCLVCEATVTIAARPDPCPACGGYQWVLVGGDEMRLKELEVE